MTPPTFSVVIPAFNAARTLPTTIDSVLKQTFADFEVVIIDDGSSDETVRVALRIAAQDDRIRVVS